MFNELTLANIRIFNDNSHGEFDNGDLGFEYTLVGNDNINSLNYYLQDVIVMASLENSIKSEPYATLYPISEQPFDIGITPDEAIKEAQEVFTALGAGDDIRPYKVYYAHIPENCKFNDIKCYAVEFKRFAGEVSINNIVSRSVRAEEREEYKDTNPFNTGTPYECMVAFVNAEGILHLVWKEPLEQVQILNDDVALAEFSEVMSRFKQEFENGYSYKEDEEEIMPYDVFNIEMSYGYARVPNENNLYMAIPLWDFYAKKSETLGNGVAGEYEFSLMTINAIDKSRFVRSWGY